MSATEQATAFLGSVFGRLHHLDTPTFIALSRAEPGRFLPAGFHAADDLERAAARAVELDAEPATGVYIGCAPLVRIPERGRGTAADVGALVALWADVDIAGPGHGATVAGHQLCTDIDQALDVIAAIGPEPTVVVHTGGGLHAWFALREPWLLDDDVERAQADELAGRWGRAVQHLGARLGRGVDNVGDLARVLRIPGTTNRKPGRAPTVVELVDLDPSRRYELADLTDAIPSDLPAIEPPRPPAPPANGRRVTGPADAIEAAASWSDVLEPHGWRLYGMSGDTCTLCGQRREYWSHPAVAVDQRGRPDHPSAAACHALRLYSTNGATGLPPRTGGFSRFTVFAVLNWPAATVADSERAAARAIRAHARRAA